MNRTLTAMAFVITSVLCAKTSVASSAYRCAIVGKVVSNPIIRHIKNKNSTNLIVKNLEQEAVSMIVIQSLERGLTNDELCSIDFSIFGHPEKHVWPNIHPCVGTHPVGTKFFVSLPLKDTRATTRITTGDVVVLTAYYGDSMTPQGPVSYSVYRLEAFIKCPSKPAKTKSR